MFQQLTVETFARLIINLGIVLIASLKVIIVIQDVTKVIFIGLFMVSWRVHGCYVFSFIIIKKLFGAINCVPNK